MSAPLMAFRDHYGRDGDPILVWRGETLTMNPNVDQDLIRQAYAADSATATAEYGAEFREDLAEFVSVQLLDSLVARGVREHPAQDGIRYVAFCDPAGGAGQDAMTLAIAHAEGTRAVVDRLLERHPPFSPEDVIRDFAAVLQSYRIAQVSGDRYAGEWPPEGLRRYGITYAPATLSKSELYVNLVPVLSSRELVLLDHPRLVRQLGDLERRTARGGHESIDHPPGGHDDLANALAGVAYLVRSEGQLDPLALVQLAALQQAQLPETRTDDDIRWVAGDYPDMDQVTDIIEP